jgi:hypothetical protein
MPTAANLKQTGSSLKCTLPLASVILRGIEIGLSESRVLS